MTTDSYVAYIGIDWADRKHDIALYDWNGTYLRCKIEGK